MRANVLLRQIVQQLFILCLGFVNRICSSQSVGHGYCVMSMVSLQISSFEIKIRLQPCRCVCVCVCWMLLSNQNIELK